MSYLTAIRHIVFLAHTRIQKILHSACLGWHKWKVSLVHIRVTSRDNKLL